MYVTRLDVWSEMTSQDDGCHQHIVSVSVAANTRQSTGCSWMSIVNAIETCLHHVTVMETVLLSSRDSPLLVYRQYVCVFAVDAMRCWLLSSCFTMDNDNDRSGRPSQETSVMSSNVHAAGKLVFFCRVEFAFCTNKGGCGRVCSYVTALYQPLGVSELCARVIRVRCTCVILHYIIVRHVNL